MTQKQIASLVVAMSAVIFMAGCGSGKPEPATPAPVKTAQSNAAVSASPPGNSAPATVNGMRLPPQRPGGEPLRPPLTAPR